MREIVKQILNKNQISQRQLAVQVGVAQSFISDIIRGKKKESKILKLINALHVEYGIPFEDMINANTISQFNKKVTGMVKRSKPKKKVTSNKSESKKPSQKAKAKARATRATLDKIKAQRKPKITKATNSRANSAKKLLIRKRSK